MLFFPDFFKVLVTSLLPNLGYENHESTDLVSFPSSGGYVKLNPANFYDVGEMVLYFRTNRPSGLLAYLADDFHEDVLAVQLVDGRVEVIFSKDMTDITRIQSNEYTYDDDMWHSVSISKIKSKKIRLRVDEVDIVRANFKTQKSVKTDGVMLIGGLPSYLSYNRHVITDFTPLVGCVANMTLGSIVQDFAMKLSDVSANYNGCLTESDTQSVRATPPAQMTSGVVTTTAVPGECKLGLPGSGTIDSLDAGAGFFGATSESRYEFESLGREYVTCDDISFNLKTAAEYGVLYYTADARQCDFTSLYLEDGYLVYTFDYGSGAVVVQSEERVNDNLWHEVRTMRENSNGRIFVDGELVGEGQLTGSSRYLSVETPIYVGGLPSDLIASDIQPTKSRVSLTGCIRDFRVYPPRNKLSEFAVLPCVSTSREHGVFFGQSDGFLILEENFNVGVNVAISLEIKPRKTTGTIFSVQKPSMDFMSLEMRDGELFLTVENGGGEFTATFSPAGGEFALCDGKWHHIIVNKASYFASLTVDGVPGVEGLSTNTDHLETDTNDPFYFGGLPANRFHGGIIENEDYFGCIKNVAINGDYKSLTNTRVSGDVDQRSCPTN